MQIVL